ncbi:MAG: DegQ family serine endoprotease [Rhizobiales bacterium]|nr:DegQ family serine endoprotease [Hyphomicrobiales bacterium]
MTGRKLQEVRKLAFGAVAAALILASPVITRPAAADDLPSIANLAERLLPSVVEISVTQAVDSDSGIDSLPMPDLGPNSPFREFFDDFFKKRRQGEGPALPRRNVNSMGSGFVVDANGIVVTNNHVIEKAETIEVRFQDGTSLKAELVGRDPKTDLAVLRVKPEAPLPAVKFGNSDALRVGDWVLAIGNPFGLGGSVSLGIVSARNRDINAGPYDDFIQTDAAINKGNSGGPLFNLAGEVVGINTAIYSPSGGSVGIGFSVPAATAKGVIDQLIEFGETRRGWLGVRIQSVTDDIAESLNLGKRRGALVADVTPTGPAEKAGIQAGDVIVEFNGRPVNEMKDLPRIVADTPVGSSAPVKVLRKGQEVAVVAVVGRLEDGEKIVATQTSTGQDGIIKTLGMTLAPLDDDTRRQFGIDAGIEGAVVTAVESDSTAAEKRIEAGDVITEAGEKEVTAPGDVDARVKEAEKGGKNSVLLLVSKGGKQGEMRFIAVKIKKG